MSDSFAGPRDLFRGRFVRAGSTRCIAIGISVICGAVNAAAPDAAPTGGGNGGQEMLEAKSDVTLYANASDDASAGTAHPGDFPLKSEGKTNGRYKVSVNNGTYYVSAMDVTVRRTAKVVCTGAPVGHMAAKMGASSEQCK